MSTDTFKIFCKEKIIIKISVCFEFSANFCPNVCQMKDRLTALTCDERTKALNVIKLLSFASKKQTTQQKERPKAIITVKSK